MDNYQKELVKQVAIRNNAVDLIKVVNELWFNQSVELVFFRNKLINCGVGKIQNLIEYARNFVQKPVNLEDTLLIAKEIANLHLAPSKIDLGKLAYEFLKEDNESVNHKGFVMKKVQTFINDNAYAIKPKDVVLYGFGRIGRILARELMYQAGKGEQLRLRAIVTRGEITEDVLAKRASLLTQDSIHGNFEGTVSYDLEKKALIINGTTVYMITAQQPEDIDYTLYDIADALIIDNTGAFRDDKALKRHLEAKGADKVLLTAPAKGEVPNIVYGVNHKENGGETSDLFSAASCTTNAISPILKVIEDEFDLENGHIETIHAYTNDQNLVDNMHKKYRRGRAAALNMVITETGAGKAVAKAIPSLQGKLTSSAIRVPVPNGSLAILKLNLKRATSKEEINQVFKKYALDGDLVNQIRYSINNELVSSDIVGTTTPSVYDSCATQVSANGKNVVLYIWYDNEYGYCHQVMRLAKNIGGVNRVAYL